MPHIRDAALDLYRDREKQKADKNALLEYRRAAKTCNNIADNGSPCFSDECLTREAGEWCDICEGAQPLWESYRKSANLAGASLRKLLRLCRKAEES